MILKNTVIGIDIINPGTPQTKPQNMSMIRMVTTLIEKDFHMKIGSRIDPNNT